MLPNRKRVNELMERETLKDEKLLVKLYSPDNKLKVICMKLSQMLKSGLILTI